jgi:hypothetical protein
LFNVKLKNKTLSHQNFSKSIINKGRGFGFKMSWVQTSIHSFGLVWS